MIWWTGLAPWEFEFPFPGSLVPILLWDHHEHALRQLAVRPVLQEGGLQDFGRCLGRSAVFFWSISLLCSICFASFGRF